MLGNDFKPSKSNAWDLEQEILVEKKCFFKIYSQKNVIRYY